MAVSVAPALCVEAMNVANSTRSLVSSPWRFKELNSSSRSLRARAILRTRVKLLAGEGIRYGRIGGGGKGSGVLGREGFGRFCVRASRGDEDKDLRFSQQVRERSDSEQEEEGVSEGGVAGEEVSVSEFHEEDSAVADVGSRGRFRNRFLGLVKLRTNIAEAAEGVFKSEIRRRIFVTIVLLMASRAGYFIPLPGFDRRSMPGDYLGFVSGAVEELGDAVSELKLSVFQLGISPYILSSIVMQVSCHLIPGLVKLRKEGIDGNEKIKKYTWWLAFGVAVVESLGIAIHSIPYSVYAAQNRFGYLAVTTGLLTFGAVTLNWICDKITDAGFGQGSSLIICIGILKGYSETILKMLMNLQRGSTGWGPSIFIFLGVFLVITMWAVLVTEGRRKIKMVYYNFELAPTKVKADLGLQEVEPYIPFNINPTGMQPVLTTTYLMAVPSLVANFTRPGGFWHQLRSTLNPAWPPAPGASPLVFYGINALFIFIFNILDIVDTPKEISEYLMKIGARVPNVKPGRQTIKYLTEVQQSTRFCGGILLATLVTVSTIVDNRFRAIHQGGSIGFTSMLIIVGSIIELRRSYMAYNVMPELSKVLKRYGV
ncbi:hypothetical protein KC19_10G067000 [Ceratodon purpureus]|uniref:Uncharacterized protein n=1 Tax=Ceratodon purpureus TaxID=3225 RepID=A0A8T0GHV0_CERPU|nr:hypothetical protein KC19_10G067000 [Ceratodon purpureus]